MVSEKKNKTQDSGAAAILPWGNNFLEEMYLRVLQRPPLWEFQSFGCSALDAALAYT